MLRLTNSKRTYDVPIKVGDEETIFVVRSISVDDKMQMLNRIANIDTAADSYRIVLDILGENITEIKGYEGQKPIDILNSLEHMQDVRDILTGVLGFSALSKGEVENLSSSLEPGQTASAKSAEPNAKKDSEKKDAEPVSTTPTGTV